VFFIPKNCQGTQLKKITGAILLLPLLASGATGVPSDPKTAQACYQNLPAAGAKEDVLKAIACLKDNPFAGEATLRDFQKSHGALLEKLQQASADGEVKAALTGLAAQKAKRLYISYQSRGRDAAVFVVDRIQLGGERPSPVLDFNALNISFTHTSAIFGKDKQVPLRDVRAFSYEAAGNPGIGRFTTVFTDKRQVADDSYQGHYPLIAYDPEDRSYWAALLSLAGTSYQVSPPRKNENDRISLKQEDLDGYQLTFLGEEEAKQRIADIEQKINVDRNARAQAEQAAREKAKAQEQIYMQKKAQALAEMAKVPRGTEDSCKRTDLGGYVVKYDPDSVQINCQFGGVIQLEDLKSAGWLVVNKTKDKDGVVTDYYIRKAR